MNKSTWGTVDMQSHNYPDSNQFDIGFFHKFESLVWTAQYKVHFFMMIWLGLL